MRIHDGLAARGVGMAAISVDEQAESEKLAQELKIPFPLLRDDRLAVATAYGVAMEGRDIAVPSVFVVRQDGRIFWKKVGESIRDRPTPAEIIVMTEKAMAAPAPATP